MVHVTLADDSSSVTVPSGTITGPLSFWADEVTHDTTDYDQGMILVQAGAIRPLSQTGPAHSMAWPYLLPVLFALAFIAARLR